MKRRYVLKNKVRFITIVFTVLILVSTFIFATSAYGYKEPGFKIIKVKTGDTLWDIANKYGKNGDIRKYIYEIKKVNKLASSKIFAGDELMIPQ